MRAATIESASPAETERLAAAAAAELHAGDVVVISGDVGTGKTTFVRGACRALGVEGVVASPSFPIGRTYQGRVAVSHIDLFRLDSLEGEDPSLLDDYLGPATVAFVEWPRAAASALAPARVALSLVLSHAGGDRRLIEASGRDEIVYGMLAAFG
jgi:tRNA threonylcarbamoyladenosine biosynthesis protein TsaE